MHRRIVIMVALALVPYCASTQTTTVDRRDAFAASLYLGEAVDSFAGDETINYLNPDASGDEKRREVGGIDFEYRLWGAPDTKSSGRLGKTQLWVFGETVHGVRSRDVDCSLESNKNLSICTEAGFSTEDPQGRFVYMLRNASSLEAFAGFRWEFLPLQSGNDSQAAMYLKTQFGFLTVEGGGGDVVDLHHAGIGAKAVSGPFRSSHLEIGYGRNDLFLRNRNSRFKIDGYLSISPKAIPIIRKLAGESVRPFAQIVADVDLGTGSDSVQSYFGLDFLFGE